MHWFRRASRLVCYSKVDLADEFNIKMASGQNSYVHTIMVSARKPLPVKTLRGV